MPGLTCLPLRFAPLQRRFAPRGPPRKARLPWLVGTFAALRWPGPTDRASHAPHAHPIRFANGFFRRKKYQPGQPRFARRAGLRPPQSGRPLGGPWVSALRSRQRTRQPLRCATRALRFVMSLASRSSLDATAFGSPRPSPEGLGGFGWTPRPAFGGPRRATVARMRSLRSRFACYGKVWV